jgi:hypothetical protein
MLTDYGPRFLFWLMDKTWDFYVYQWKWVDLLDLYAEADV